MLAVIDYKIQIFFVWDPFGSNFDGIYIASTFLTPAYRGLLEDSQSGLVKGYLTDLMMEDIQDYHGGFTNIHSMLYILR